MDSAKAVRGLSIAESMAAANYEALVKNEEDKIDWEELSPDVRQHFIEAMVAAIETVPDWCTQKKGFVAETTKLGPGREAILGEHRRAQVSVLRAL